MPSLATVRGANAKFAPSYVPTAVFVGGTSGIGKAMAEAFAKHTKGAANIIIIGRNREAAEKIISTFPKSTTTTATAQHEFVSCEATLMKNVHATTQQLSGRMGKINYLVLSCGALNFSGRQESVEGIDAKLALNYYARWKFIDGLLPLLQKAKESGEEARVMTVLAAGRGGQIDLTNLDLKTGYTLMSAAAAAGTYNDLLVKEFSQRYPTLSFVHSYPGFVYTPLLNFHWSTRFLSPVMKPFSTSPADCAEWMLYPLLSPEFDKGGYWVNNKADKVTKSGYATDEAGQKLWEHTAEVTKT